MKRRKNWRKGLTFKLYMLHLKLIRKGIIRKVSALKHCSSISSIYVKECSKHACTHGGLLAKLAIARA